MPERRLPPAAREPPSTVPVRPTMMAATELLDDNGVDPRDIGATLRSARETAGFSVAEVAEQMRLSRHHIENLEAERFDLFPVAVFLRGYLTSYARLLGIDAEPLLEEYDRRGFGPPQLHSQDTSRESPRGSEFTVTVTTLVVIAVLIVLSALWWREQWSDEGALTNGAAEQTEENRVFPRPGAQDDEPGDAIVSRPVTAPAVPAGESEAGSGEPADAVAAPDAGQVEPATDAPPVEVPGEESVAQDEPDTGTEPEGPADSVATAETEAPAQPVAADAADEGGESATATGAAASAPGEAVSLLIRIHEDCWLMIRDADQRLVFRDIAGAGTVLDLSVVPPVRVVAGYASGIEIEYDGEPYDLTPHVEPETGTARFRLGS